MNDVQDDLQFLALQDLARRHAERSLHPDDYEYAEVLGGRVQQARDAKGLTRMQLALATGVGDRRIQLLEHGLLHIDEVDDDMIETLADGLDLDAADLFYGVDPAPNPFEKLRQWVRETGAVMAGNLRLDPTTSGMTWSPEAVPVGVLRRGKSRVETTPTVEVVPAEDEQVRLVIDLGVSQAAKRAVIVAATTDQDARDIARVDLDDQGYGEILIPQSIPGIGPVTEAVLAVGLIEQN